MYIVGMYVAIDPDSFDLVVPEIKSMCHIEIKSQDPETGKLLLNVASNDELEHKYTFETIRSLPFVMEAEIIYFYQYKDVEYTQNRSDLAQSATQLYKSYNTIIHTRH